MKEKIGFYILFATFFYCCHSTDKKNPDISNIHINLTLQRFEQDFFSIDTNHIEATINIIQKKYPDFFKDFTNNILGIGLYQPNNIEQEKAIRSFITSYKSVKDSVDMVFADFAPIQKEIEEGFKYIKYYFPKYSLPKKIICFIGPLDAYFQGSLDGYSDVLTQDAIAIGLQLHLGKNCSLYTSSIGQALYPSYISRRFEPNYIVVNCIKNIIDDLYPDNTTGKPLIDQMIDRGKRLYLLNRLLPNTADSLKIGYTQEQLKGCYEHESIIWSMFVQNDLLYTIEPNIIKIYIGNSPNTQALGNDAPGNIGLFVGLEIVNKYMQSNTISLDSLLKTPNHTIFEQAHYKPK